MKALHVWERIFHYVKIWLFVLAVALIAYSFFSVAAVAAALGEEGGIDWEAAADAGFESADDVFVAFLGFASLPLLLLVGAGLFWALEHIFKKVQVIRSRECKSCCKEEEGDAQVEKIMKWKDFYNEGIITEREFIQKRNEILGLHK